MMKENMSFILAPLPLFLLFAIVGAFLLLAGRWLSAKGEDNPGKHEHYACGEDLELVPGNIHYHVFFRLALLFGILHIVALIISTVALDVGSTKALPILYVAGAAVSMLILLERDEYKT